MPVRSGLLGALLMLAVPALAAAQERSCRQVLPSDARRLFNAQGQEIIYFRDPVRVLCTGGLVLEADSAVMNRTAAAVELIGSVLYRDTLRELTADWANYIGERSQLLARGSVVLENLADGSVVQGQELDYLQATETRPVSNMVVRGERPYARIPPRPDSTGQVPDSAVATEVWADRMEFEGEEYFRGLGNVEILRGDLSGAADSATFDQSEERVALIGSAHVLTDRYRLEGRRIDASLSENELRSVFSERDARAISDDMTVEAERIRIAIVDGRLDRMEAWNPKPDSVPRALADARDFRLRADSIDARADSLGLEVVRAIGNALGVRDPDTTAQGPEPVVRDWIQGDTIIGFFSRPGRVGAPADTGALTDTAVAVALEPSPTEGGVRPPVSIDDTAGAASPGGRGPNARDSAETVLERVIVFGGPGPALALYRATEDGGQRASINFIEARTITLHMTNGNVTRVEADGPLEGLYLSPAQRDTTETGGSGEEGGGEADRGGAS